MWNIHRSKWLLRDLAGGNILLSLPFAQNSAASKDIRCNTNKVPSEYIHVGDGPGSTNHSPGVAAQVEKKHKSHRITLQI